MGNLLQILALGLATSAISVTLSRGKIFDPFRKWVSSRNAWLGNLVSCHYCTSHWVSIAFVAIYQPKLVQRWYPLDLLVSMFATVAVAALLSGTVVWLFSAKADRVEEIDQLRAALEAAKDKLIEQDKLIKTLQK